MKLKKDDLVIMTEGEYSYYGILDTFRVLQDFDTNEVMTTYLTEHPEQKPPMEPFWFGGDFECGTFQNWCIAQKYIEELKMEEWHPSDYGRAKLQDDDGEVHDFNEKKETSTENFPILGPPKHDVSDLPDEMRSA